ncbi:dihydroxyacetone kinase subunit DhaL [Salibacterium aidingense]|uniref:dihydroxyacetone kinase subunit DhaL n=1 Tax=Salibacterium aidingense TaxID=384933 RepID=UPI00040EA1F8|nr:dihydroxyacetone kinase subunit DhaL [Salibacterium aidingense]
MNAYEWKQYFSRISNMVEKEKDYLSELDRKLGDGDHGVTMSIGWKAVKEELQTNLQNENDCGTVAMKVGRTFLSAVGSSVGPLYASGLISGAKAVKGKAEISHQDAVVFWIQFVSGVHERGQAQVGDKTMVDTFLPIQEELKRSGDLIKALDAAKQGMESTKQLESKRGRSSRLKERSIGHQDPGATSAYLIFSLFVEQFS